MKIHKFNTNCGFTLSELMVVVSIIAILVAATTIGGLNVLRRAQATRIASDFRQIETAWVTWRADTHHQYPKENEYPPNPPGYCDDEPLMQNTNLFNNHELDDETAPNPRWNGPYLEDIPLDPWRRQYTYDNDEDASGVYIFLTYLPADAGRYNQLIPILDELIDNSDGTGGRFGWYSSAACGGIVYRIIPGPATY
ncbi:MAG: hypothetical protein UU81_C0018G0008 [Microgenomates group bacterium GW2011_GWC1_41_8]|nr:MAG: hypothetical protein UU81_C0018G0008 [Microgenomates group bacterium GW2011_GWC1_41_8]